MNLNDIFTQMLSSVWNNFMGFTYPGTNSNVRYVFLWFLIANILFDIAHWVFWEMKD